MAERSTETPNIAVFCDFENVALGARDAGYGEFDVRLALERLLAKGQVVVKKAYSDWETFKNMRRQLHEAAFELIEIPHVSYSGKNSADIRMVVDALDLCYTKPHVQIFAIISGDSDFSPLVSKLRENAKKVIGVGVKNSTSELLRENCDEFIYYDDLVRTKQRRGKGKKRQAKDKPKSADAEQRREEGLEAVVEVAETLLYDREEPVWGSHVKQTLKRKRPHFDETYHGYRSFSALLEDAQDKGLLVLKRDDKSGGYLVTDLGPAFEE